MVTGSCVVSVTCGNNGSHTGKCDMKLGDNVYLFISGNYFRHCIWVFCFENQYSYYMIDDNGRYYK